MGNTQIKGVKNSVVEKYKLNAKDKDTGSGARGWQNLVANVSLQKKNGNQSSASTSAVSTGSTNNTTTTGTSHSSSAWQQLFLPNVEIMPNPIESPLNLRVCNNCNKPITLRSVQKHMEFCTNPQGFLEKKIMPPLNKLRKPKKLDKLKSPAAVVEQGKPGSNKRKLKNDDNNTILVGDDNNAYDGDDYDDVGDDDDDDVDLDDDEDEDDDDEDDDDDDDTNDGEDGEYTGKNGTKAKGAGSGNSAQAKKLMSPQRVTKKRKTNNTKAQQEATMLKTEEGVSPAPGQDTKLTAKMSKQLEKKQKLAKKQEERALQKRLKQEEKVKQQQLKKHQRIKLQQEKLLKQQLKQQQQQLLLEKQQPKKLTPEEETHNVLTGISKSYPLPLENYVLSSSRLKTKSFRMRQMFSKCFNTKQGFSKPGYGDLMGRVGYIDIQRPNEYAFKIDFSRSINPSNVNAQIQQQQLQQKQALLQQQQKYAQQQQLKQQQAVNSQQQALTNGANQNTVQPLLTPDQILAQQNSAGMKANMDPQALLQKQAQLQHPMAQRNMPPQFPVNSATPMPQVHPVPHEVAIHAVNGNKMPQVHSTPLPKMHEAITTPAQSPSNNVHQGLGNAVNVGISSPFQPNTR